MLKNRLINFKNVLFESKKYILLYLFCIIILSLSTISMKNIIHPKFEILSFIFVSIIGIFCIGYYFIHNSNKELYKTAFVIILCFGIICSFIVPIVDVSDEVEHITRAEITSRGVFIPHWTGDEVGIDRAYNLTDGEISTAKNNGIGYESIYSIDFFKNNREITIFETSHDTDKINYSNYIIDSSFEQNPFYGYLPQAFGILIAKLLDLNVIWMLWLGRIFNLICYACLTSLAIKITPKLKIHLLTVACIPITIYQAASVSIDSMIIGLGLLTIAYFIYLCNLENNTLDIKEICIFTALCLLLGLCKLPYLAFIFLILFIPKTKFKDNYYFYGFLSIIFVSIIGILWSNYSTPTLLHSWRSSYNYINSTQQIDYLINNPPHIFKFLQQIFTSELVNLSNGVFNFFNGKLGAHYQDTYYLITLCIQIFLTIVLLVYPTEFKFENKTKIGSFLVLMIIYIGTCFIQLLTWAYVGQMGLGLCLRYFIPLLGLIPIISYFNLNNKNKKYDDYIVVLIISFLAMLILSFSIKYY